MIGQLRPACACPAAEPPPQTLFNTSEELRPTPYQCFLVHEHFHARFYPITGRGMEDIVLPMEAANVLSDAKQRRRRFNGRLQKNSGVNISTHRADFSIWVIHKGLGRRLGA